MNRTTITALACTATLGAGLLLAGPSDAATGVNSDLHIVFVSHCQPDSSGFYNTMRAFRNEARADRVFNRPPRPGQPGRDPQRAARAPRRRHRRRGSTRHHRQLLTP
jgi:hypothetical protein